MAAYSHEQTLAEVSAVLTEYSSAQSLLSRNVNEEQDVAMSEARGALKELKQRITEMLQMCGTQANGLPPYFESSYTDKNGHKQHEYFFLQDAKQKRKVDDAFVATVFLQFVGEHALDLSSKHAIQESAKQFCKCWKSMEYNPEATSKLKIAKKLPPRFLVPV